LGLPQSVVERIIRDVTQRIAREFTLIVQQHDALCKAAPAERGRYLAIEQRLLRVMQHITLKDMLERLIPPGKQ
jgi:hypothetical protein